MIVLGETLYDGYDPRFEYQVGVTKQWQDGVTRSLKYSRTLRRLAASWVIKPYSTIGPIGGFLIDQSIPRPVGAGEVEWVETYANVPAPRTVCESVTFPLAFISGTDLGEIPLTTGAQTLYEYFYDPTGIVQPFRSWRLIKINDNVFFSTGIRPAGTGPIIAQDSKVRNWAGYITERATPYTTVRDILQISS